MPETEENVKRPPGKQSKGSLNSSNVHNSKFSNTGRFYAFLNLSFVGYCHGNYINLLGLIWAEYILLEDRRKIARLSWALALRVYSRPG